MHELSLAIDVVHLAMRQAAARGNCRVIAVTLRVGRLAGVHEDALRHGFEIARLDTPLEEAELQVVTVPVRVWCGPCRAERELPGVERCACPVCGTPSGDIRAGRELDLESLTIVETADA